MWNIIKGLFKRIRPKTAPAPPNPIQKAVSEGAYWRPDNPGTAPGQPSFSASPETMRIGNDIFHKNHQKAIDDGLRLLEESPDNPMVHINLMDAYSKGRSLDPSYLDKSTEHAKLAMLCGHHTGYAEYRLAVNLERKGYFHQSIQLYNLILNTPGFHFSRCGMGNSVDFKARMDKAVAKLPRAKDDESSILFSDADIRRIIKGIKDADWAEIKAQKAFEERMKKMRERIMKM